MSVTLILPICVPEKPMSLVSAPNTSPGRIFSLRPPRICSVTIGGRKGSASTDAVSALSGCQTLALPQVAMQLERHDALRLQHRHQVAALLLGVAEGERAHGPVVFEQQAHGV